MSFSEQLNSNSNTLNNQWVSELIKTKKDEIFVHNNNESEEYMGVLHWICATNNRELFSTLATLTTNKKKEKRAFFHRVHNHRTAYELCLLSSNLPLIDLFLRVEVFDIFQQQEGTESAFELTLNWFFHLYPSSNHTMMDKDSIDEQLISASDRYLDQLITPQTITPFHLILRKFKAIMLQVIKSDKRSYFEYLLEYYTYAIIKAMRSRCYSALSLMLSIVPITTHMTGKHRSQIIDEYKGDLPTLSLLLRHQFDFFAENNANYSALQNFAARGYLHSLLLLHRHYLSSPSLNQQNGFTCVQKAFSNLLFAPTRGGMTALHFAALSNRTGTLRYLLSFPSAISLLTYPNVEGMTPLHCAATKGRTAAFDLLLQSTNFFSLFSLLFPRCVSFPLSLPHVPTLPPHTYG